MIAIFLRIALRAVLALLAVLLFSSTISAQTWESIAPMRFARAEHKSIVLSDQRILVVGGYGSNKELLLECEIYNPQTNTWSSGGRLNQGRRRHELIRMEDGRIVAISGMIADNASVTTSNEIYDPVTNTWTELQPLRLGRSTFSATLLPDSTIMVLGGLNVSTTINNVELLDPIRDVVRDLPNMLVRVWALNTYYAYSVNGVVARGGGQGGSAGPYLKNTQMFSLETQQWSMQQDAISAQSTPDKGAIVLDDERILVPSGRSGETTLTKLVESFDPFTGKWKSHGQLFRDHDLTQVLRAGRDSILVIAGDVDPPVYNNILDDCTWFNIVTGETFAGPTLITPRFRHQAETISLNDESQCMTRQFLFVMGGMTDGNIILSSCERLDLGLKPKIAEIAVSPRILSLPEECDAPRPIELRVEACEEIELVGVERVGDFELMGPQLPMTLVNGTQNLLLQLTGSPNAEGSIKLTFKTPVGEQVKYLRVSGSGGSERNPLALPSSLAFSGSRCDSSNTTLVVHSLDCDSLTIESIEALAPHEAKFVVDEPLPVAIATLGTAAFKLTYVGEENTLATKLRIRFRRGNALIDTLVDVAVALDGDPSSKSRAMMSDLLTPYAGEVITLPLNLTRGDEVTSQGYELELTFDTDLLEILDPEFLGTVTPASSFDLTRTPTGARLFVPAAVTLSSAEPLIKFRFKTFVSPNKCTQVRLKRLIFSPDDPTFSTCVMSVNLDSALVCVQDQCGDPALRRVMAASDEQISRIAYGGGKIVVDYDAVADASFEVYDMLGHRVNTYVAMPSPATIDTRGIPAGAYVLRMTTPLSVRSKRITIVR